MVVDHLEYVNYRVEYISNRLLIFDLVIWFGADNYQCGQLIEKKRYCNHPNIKIVNLNHKIKDGRDFAIMQDMSFSYIKEHYDYSICAFQSADELLTDYGIKAVDNWIKHSKEQFALFAAMSNKMFCETFNAELVFQIFRRGQEYRSNNGLSDNIRFCNDIDMNTNIKISNLGYSDKEKYNYIIDTGYIDALACYQKIVNWGRLCYGDANKTYLAELYKTGQKELFIKEFIRLHISEFHRETDKKVTPVKYEGEYKRLIDDLDLKDDYDLTVKLINEL